MAALEGGAGKGVRARLWDGPVRLVHWSLVALVAFAWWSAKDHLEWHRWAGYAALGLVVFRIYWGFAGAGAARFSSFVKGPRAVVAYARTIGARASSVVPGHNPLGALSVLAILALLVVQTVSGLFAVDIDGIESGPLSDRVSFETGRKLAGLHHQCFTALEVLIALHVAAVAFYLVWKRTDLVGPMISGRARFPNDPGLARAPWWRLAAGIGLAALVAGLAAKGFLL